MQISDITQRKKKPISEVNWGAIGGALAGIAGQAITGNTPQAAPGQEAKVAKQLNAPSQNIQIDSVQKTWSKAVAAKMAELGVTDTKLLNTQMLTDLATEYIQNRLFAGQTTIASLAPRHRNRIQQDINNVVAATQSNNASSLKTALEKTVNDIHSATMNRVFSNQYHQPGAASPGAQLTPATQVMMQRMAPQIAQLQQRWPAGQNQQVAPTNNQAVNALLAGLGLLTTSSGPVTPTPGTEE